MPQFKKPAVRKTILDSALRLFEQNGYSGTTMKDIADEAAISASNIYNYFQSKLDILFAIYGPWLLSQLDELEHELARLRSPRTKLRHIIATLWDIIPAKDNGFANNLMQALSTVTPEEKYSRETLYLAENKLNKMIRDCLPKQQLAVTYDAALAHVLFMAFDGFAMNYRLVGRSRRMDSCIDAMVLLLMGEKTGKR